jgi:ribonucleoside-triphosphate reductase
MKCGQVCEIYSRIVGYFRPLQNWNKGKKQEFEDRKLFKVPNIEEIKNKKV